MSNTQGRGARLGTNGWRNPRAWGLRFVAIYVLLYTIPFPLHRLPWLGAHVSQIISDAWRTVGLWVGHHVLGIEGEIFAGPSQSSDTTLDYIRLLVMVVLALVVSSCWTVLDRRHRDRPDERLGVWLAVGCRYFVASILLGYGLGKVIPVQFETPSLGRVLSTFGETTPMSMLWVFMGMSPAYTMFSGWAETVGGALLAFRRTRTLGAMVALPVLVNVAVLNLCYDVSNKLFSLHLVVMVSALAWPGVCRLYTVTVGNRMVAPAPDLHPVPSRRGRLVGRVVGTLLMVSVAWTSFTEAWDHYHANGNGRPKPAIWGIHDVETFRRDGVEVPPRWTDTSQWRVLAVDRALPTLYGDESYPGSVQIRHFDGTAEHLPVVLDETASTLTFLADPQGRTDGDMPAADEPDVLHYEQRGSGELVVRGRWRGADVEVSMVTRDPRSIKVLGHRFHWVSEFPRMF